MSIGSKGRKKHWCGERGFSGLDVLAILTLLSEIGTNMAKWRNERAFVSWLGLSPNNKISGQRVLSSRTRKVVNRAATTLRLAAMVLGKSDTPLGSFYRRKRAQLGAPKAITATARKLGCLIYQLIKKGQAYQEPDRVAGASTASACIDVDFCDQDSSGAKR